MRASTCWNSGWHPSSVVTDSSVFSSAPSSSSVLPVPAITASTSAATTVDSFLCSAGPATCASAPIARALTGGVSSDGIRIGNSTSAFVTMISCSAASAFSEASVSSSSSSCGMISSTATLPTASWSTSNACAAASRTPGSASTSVWRTILNRGVLYSRTVAGAEDWISSRTAMQMPCFASASDATSDASSVGNSCASAFPPTRLTMSPSVVAAMLRWFSSAEASRRTIVCVSVGRISLTVRGVFATSAFQILTAAIRTGPELSERHINSAASTRSRLSAPRTSLNARFTFTDSTVRSSDSSCLPLMPLILNSRSPVSSTLESRMRGFASERPRSNSGSSRSTALLA
ncbi:hypothetical protein OGATHE_004840 [Ogataea polymorpha]|uniref:Uncharacterized protein n=1 Tax=Ogataea polymorpha TaxID=460523 RepID=A0A9P8P1B7_9ASCO|nr:hypothetical protein OGATHE_004840 [Ogataea polymorpha]